MSIKICKHTLGLVGRTSFKETELRDFFLQANGDDVLCLGGTRGFEAHERHEGARGAREAREGSGSTRW